MRLLLDMNLPPAMASRLRSEGHDAVHLRDLQMNTLPDRDVFARAAADDRVVITFDLDFGDLAGAVAGAGPGVVLLRLRSPRQAHLRERVRVALALTENALASGAVVLVEDARIRVRTLRSATDIPGGNQ
jgi:predicted nuclease of predicted toxin-antitoxin system